MMNDSRYAAAHWRCKHAHVSEPRLRQRLASRYLPSYRIIILRYGGNLIKIQTCGAIATATDTNVGRAPRPGICRGCDSFCMCDIPPAPSRGVRSEGNICGRWRGRGSLILRGGTSCRFRHDLPGDYFCRHEDHEIIRGFGTAREGRVWQAWGVCWEGTTTNNTTTTTFPIQQTQSISSF